MIIKEKINDCDLRNYVESKCKLDPVLYGILQLYDRSEFYNSLTGIYKKNNILSTSSDSLIRSEIQTFMHRINTRYKTPNKDILLILPCSSKKPYSFSKSHKKIINSIGKYRNYINEVVITSPIGLVPRELELTYPASSYDSTVTGFWDAEEINFVSFSLENYLSKNKYKYIVAHVSGSYKHICDIVSKKLNLNIFYSCTSNISSFNSIQNLKDTIQNIIFENNGKLNKLSSEKEKINIIKSIALYQFGTIAESLFSGKEYVKGIYPKYQLYSNNKKLLATLIPNSGLLSLSLEAAILLLNSDIYSGQYTVLIEDFVPMGSILAPGIIYADSNIKIGDEVIIKGAHFIGTGKAFMNGYEMCHSSKGVAISLKHTKYSN